jgi:hypothetical protein
MKTNRWGIAVCGVFLQIALGAVYAWSVFRVPLAKQFGWSISEVTLTFTISIFVLGVAAFSAVCGSIARAQEWLRSRAEFFMARESFWRVSPITNCGGSI